MSMCRFHLALPSNTEWEGESANCSAISCDWRRKVCHDRLVVEATHVPCWRAVVALSNVVVALAVAAHEQDLVSNVFALPTVVVQVIHPFGKPLPLRLGSVNVIDAIRGVLSVDETEVVLSLYARSTSTSQQYTQQANCRNIRNRTRLGSCWDHLAKNILPRWCTQSPFPSPRASTPSPARRLPARTSALLSSSLWL